MNIIFYIVNFYIALSSCSNHFSPNLNKLLFGEENPELLKYLDEEGNPNVSRQEPTRKFIKYWKINFTPERDVDILLFQNQIHLGRISTNSHDLKDLPIINFNPNLPTRVIVPGWLSSRNSTFPKETVRAYLKKGDFNVIVVDWSKGSSTKNYWIARRRIPSVAEVLSKFLKYLMQTCNLNVDDLVLVGHSLGAHICGLTGKQIPGIKAIIGLDPCYPFFSYLNKKNRLDVDDAKFVEVIHTSAMFLGFLEPLGDVDIYPNYGDTQSGCKLDVAGVCAHSKAHHLYTKSIHSHIEMQQCESFYDIPDRVCKTTGVKSFLGGEPINIMKPRGIYYL